VLLLGVTLQQDMQQRSQVQLLLLLLLLRDGWVAWAYVFVALQMRAYDGEEAVAPASS
jgi:hypothetical protein